MAANPEREGESQLEREVARACAEAAGRHQIAAPTDRLDDLGVASLALADLAVELEERLGARLADAGLDSLMTVGDVIRAVQADIRAPHRIPPGMGRLQPTAKRLGARVFRWQSSLQVEGTGF